MVLELLLGTSSRGYHDLSKVSAELIHVLATRWLTLLEWVARGANSILTQTSEPALAFLVRLQELLGWLPETLSLKVNIV